MAYQAYLAQDDVGEQGMKEIQAQFRNQCPVCHQQFGYFLLPYGKESIEIARDYNPNQIIRSKIYGIRKQRSVVQLNLYWSVCGVVAANTEHPQWDTKNKTDFQCRVAADFRDPNVVAVKPDGQVVFQYMSISFPNLGHIEACNYFDRAYDVMGKFLGVSVEELVAMTKEQMQTY